MNLGALFDWDGVVIDSSAQHEEAWRRLADEIGKPMTGDQFARGFGMTNRVIIPDILGWTSDHDEIERYSLRKEELYRDVLRRDGIRPLPGVRELLQLLRARGVPCSVASSTHRENIEAIFDATGLRPFFSAVVSAEDVTRGKPDPQVFLAGAHRIGRDPARCVVFEDAHVGIEAGLAAGCRVIAVATTHPIGELGRAHLAVNSLDEIAWERFAGLFD